MRIGSRIGERCLIHLFVGMGFACLVIEVAGNALAVMLGDEVLDDLGQVGVIGNL